MGMDLLDIHFRLEDEFRVELIETGALYRDSDVEKGVTTVTAGQVYDRLCEHLRQSGLVVPGDIWDRVRKCIGEALAVGPERIRREDRLVHDLGAT